MTGEIPVTKTPSQYLERVSTTQDQDNSRMMFEITIRFLDNNNSVWSGMVAFADAVGRAKAGLEAIDKPDDTPQKPTAALTANKAQLRRDLENKTLEMADLLAALAAKNKQDDLAKQVHVTRSSLRQLGDNDLEQTAERIVFLANNNIGELEDYGVDAAVTALETARKAFQKFKTGPRQAAAQGKGQSQSLPQLIANVGSVFSNEIDKMMTPFEKSNPDFYRGYFAARVIADRTHTHAAPTPA